jgi:hypothetical protein
VSERRSLCYLHLIEALNLQLEARGRRLCCFMLMDDCGVDPCGTAQAPAA